MEDMIKPFAEMLISVLSGKFGWFAQALLMIAPILAGARTLFKLIPGLIKIVTDSTPNVGDDGVSAKVEGSKVYKTIALALDFALSIKLPPKK